jgi:hypothetical protein
MPPGLTNSRTIMSVRLTRADDVSSSRPDASPGVLSALHLGEEGGTSAEAGGELAAAPLSCGDVPE